MWRHAYVNSDPAESADAAVAIAPSPLGALRLTASDGKLVCVEWTDETADAADPTDPLLAETRRQLDAYFDRKLEAFDLPLAPAGDPFERAVWRCMLKIPYGVTETYGFIAKETGKPARAVGGACGRNPIPIIIPCHRVVGADGKMTGYSGKGGVETKQWLLAHEGALLL